MGSCTSFQFHVPAALSKNAIYNRCIVYLDDDTQFNAWQHLSAY